MARKLYYKIIEDGINRITNTEWETILRLQHWYNSEFIWTAGKLGFRMYAVFPKVEYNSGIVDDLELRIWQRKKELRDGGLSENETIQQLETEGLIFVQKGGYFDNCIGSGFTRVAANEFNAFLVCEFLLKASILAPDAVIFVYDEGEFIKTKQVRFHQGNVIIQSVDESKQKLVQEMINNRHVFAIVDPAKYDHHPRFSNIVSDFNELNLDERMSILKDWNWLGFENNFDLYGDDVQGVDLNKKVLKFKIDTSEMKS
ncbi:MAG: hypothetical protein QME52_07685 [Bacteroidota bacterium]|nr:hypothetical protein [Bacteroidota bacterium]